MQQWFAVERVTFQNLKIARRDLIKSHALDDDPLWSRLWHLHLFWVVSFAKTSAKTSSLGLYHGVRRHCCRLVDRIFGGTREQKFREQLRQSAERHQAKVRKSRAEEADRKWRREQLMGALNQQMRENEERIVALLFGEEVVDDPSTYN